MVYIRYRYRLGKNKLEVRAICARKPPAEAGYGARASPTAPAERCPSFGRPAVRCAANRLHRSSAVAWNVRRATENQIAIK